MIKYCNLLNINRINTGGVNSPVLCLWVTKRLARCVPRGRFFYAQCGMLNDKFTMN